MNVPSPRTTKADPAFPSVPRRAIEMVAEQMEDPFRGAMPMSDAAVEGGGRIAP
ncbi:MAG TPA: hypothetical protein H9786_16265 [Candidatus Brachybacterium merdavium]|uniref:Uncharacterized protein n=1 Tax=Candidatus Brachybacterium merdavium TaxID=2838513 RepID=A0A9D2RQK2_9MICO|nr:hypothetical protein [Candidatus Brachybacterium merdavium]